MSIFRKDESTLINIASLYKWEAIQLFHECPKIITLIRHADKSDDSEFHCIWRGLYYDRQTKEKRPYSEKKVFIIPGQSVRTYIDQEYGDYVAVKVTPPPESQLYEGEMFWLFVSVRYPFGFVTPVDGVDLSKYEIASSISHTTKLQFGLTRRQWFLEYAFEGV